IVMPGSRPQNSSDSRGWRAASRDFCSGLRQSPFTAAAIASAAFAADSLFEAAPASSLAQPLVTRAPRPRIATLNDRNMFIASPLLTIGPGRCAPLHFNRSRDVLSGHDVPYPYTRVATPRNP